MNRASLSSTIFVAAGLVLAACSQAPTAPEPITAVTTLEVVEGLDVVGGHADEINGALWSFLVGTGDRPEGTPDAYDGFWTTINCGNGLLEAQEVTWESGAAVTRGLDNAWDGAYTFLFGQSVDTLLNAAGGVGTIYSDGTVVLECTASVTSGDQSANVTRYTVVAGAGDAGRFTFDVIVIEQVAGSIDLSEFEYAQDNGADDTSATWATYGSVAPFDWATADDASLDDPAIGIVSFVPVGMDVDGSEDNYFFFSDAGTLTSGETIAFGILGAVKGGFESGDGPGKDAAMLALGAELDAYDGGAICEPAASRDALFAWLDVVEDGEVILESICAGYEAL